MKFFVALLHDGMVDKQGNNVTTSLTLIDLHDISRSCKTYGVTNFFIAHPSPHMRKLAHTLFEHWDLGYGATYNSNRKDALSILKITQNLQDIIAEIDQICGQPPLILASTAKDGENRLSFEDLRRDLNTLDQPQLLLLGSGWGMGEALLSHAHKILEPISGPTDFNHLSVRSALAIMLDRIFCR